MAESPVKHRRWAYFGLGFVSLPLFLGLIFVATIGWPDPVALSDRAALSMLANAVIASDEEHAVTANFPAWSTDEWASISGRGEGLNCSIPPRVEKWMFANRPPSAGNKRSQSDLAPISLQFRQACVAHDLCYRHGAATYAYTQSQCDGFLAEAAFRICKKAFPNALDVAWCQTRARKVLGGVMLGGAGSFKGLARMSSEASSSSGRGGVAGNEESRLGALSVSTIAEYDPYPSGTAVYVLPRLIRGKCGKADAPILLTFLRRPGGSASHSRCYNPNTGRFEQALDGKYDVLIGREYDRVISPPWVTTIPARGEKLVQWCRDYGDKNSTGGRFVIQTNDLKIPGCEIILKAECDRLDKAQLSRNECERSTRFDWGDQEAVTLFPLPQRLTGPAGAEMVALGLYDSPANSSPPSAPCAIEPVSLQGQIDLARNPNFERSWHKAHLVKLPLVADRTADCYRWFATPPISYVDQAGKVSVLLSRRGTASGENYAEVLDTAHGELRPDGHLSANFELLKWAVPETAEPVVPLPTRSGLRLVGFQRELSKAPSYRKRAVIALGFALLGLGMLGFGVIKVRRKERTISPSFFLASLVFLAVSGAIFATLPNQKVPTGHAIVSLFSGDPVNPPAPINVRLLGGGRYLEQRIVFAQPSQALSCAAASGHSCKIAMLAFLPAYQYDAEAPNGLRAELIVLGFDEQGGVHARHVVLSLPNSINAKCRKSGDTALERACTYQTVSRLMMIVGRLDGSDVSPDIVVLDKDNGERHRVYKSKGSGSGWEALTYVTAGSPSKDRPSI